MNIFKLNSKRRTRCLNVKSDWDKEKIDKAKVKKLKVKSPKNFIINIF